eukprot:10636812-Alexandrium_andersonii.AAC.1
MANQARQACATSSKQCPGAQAECQPTGLAEGDKSPQPRQCSSNPGDEVTGTSMLLQDAEPPI